MKKIFLAGVLFIATIVAAYSFYKEYSFSPLKQDDFQRLFKGNNGCFNKSCGKDFLGTSFHSELFEIYQYSLSRAVVNKDFPNITEWEGKLVTNEVIVGKWKNCPIDTQTINLYKFTLSSNDFGKVDCCSSFNQEILNASNYYSFVHFSNVEQYFLLYCPDRNKLYYIRRKGF